MVGRTSSRTRLTRSTSMRGRVGVARSARFRTALAERSNTSGNGRSPVLGKRKPMSRATSLGSANPSGRKRRRLQEPEAEQATREAEYGRMLAKQLQKIARERGLSASGRKADIILRLITYDTAQEAKAAAAVEAKAQAAKEAAEEAAVRSGESVDAHASGSGCGSDGGNQNAGEEQRMPSPVSVPQAGDAEHEVGREEVGAVVRSADMDILDVEQELSQVVDLDEFYGSDGILDLCPSLSDKDAPATLSAGEDLADLGLNGDADQVSSYGDILHEAHGEQEHAPSLEDLLPTAVTVSAPQAPRPPVQASVPAALAAYLPASPPSRPSSSRQHAASLVPTSRQQAVPRVPVHQLASSSAPGAALEVAPVRESKPQPSRTAVVRDTKPSLARTSTVVVDDVIDLDFDLSDVELEEEVAEVKVDDSKRPLPPGWTMERLRSGTVMYKNQATAEISLVHPSAKRAVAPKAAAVKKVQTTQSVPFLPSGMPVSAAPSTLPSALPSSLPCPPGAAPTPEEEMTTTFVPSKHMALASTPQGMEVQLLKHQQVALAWMLKQELSEVRGGILADDMGCGKTISAISTMLANPILPLDQPQRNLVVAPLTCLLQWQEEIKTRTDRRTLTNILIYHGQARHVSVKQLAKYDVVITTHAMLASGTDIFGGKVLTGNKLHKVSWSRLVIDEAHYLKNRRTKSAIAAIALTARFRWCLTGTPVQNSLDDLQTLVQVLHFAPWSDVSHWHQMIMLPIARNPKNGFELLRNLLKKLLLRRQKTDPELQAILQLPEKSFMDEKCTFSEKERKAYDELEQKYRTRFIEMNEEGTVMSNYAHIISMIHHLRRLCCHPRLSKHTARKLMSTRLLPSEMHERLRNNDECTICMDVQQIPVATPCGHGFCEKCITDWLKQSRGSSGESKCPNCNTAVVEGDLIPLAEAIGLEEEDDIDPGFAQAKESTKVQALLAMVNAVRANDPRRKCVIISQWTSFLKLIGAALSAHGIMWTTIDGTMTMSARADSSRRFGSRPELSVMLLSMRGAGVGINLTMANKVFLMDPWWNPAVEKQAVDRVHRIGQTLPVEVTRVTIAGTIEDRILKLQEMKEALADGALGNDVESLLNASTRLSLGDFCSLFGVQEDP